MGQYAYATPALLARRGLTEVAREPLRLLAAPPKALLTPVEEMEAAFYKDTQVRPRRCCYLGLGSWGVGEPGSWGAGELGGAAGGGWRLLRAGQVGAPHLRMPQAAPARLASRLPTCCLLHDAPRPTCCPARLPNHLQWGRELLDALDHDPVKAEEAEQGALFTEPYASSMARLTHLVGAPAGPPHEPHQLRQAALGRVSLARPLGCICPGC